MRKSGYYWIQFHSNSEWIISKWNGKEWGGFIGEILRCCTDDMLFKIDEKQISRNNE